MSDQETNSGPATLGRRSFLRTAGVAEARFGKKTWNREGTAVSSHILAPLPYAENALEPVITAQTVRLHYGEHHRGYVKTLNELVAGTCFAGMTLEKIISATAGRPDYAPIFNNAAQAWNHAFYWNSMKADGGGTPPEELRDMIEDSYGTLDGCKRAFARVAASHVGSGWAWLVREGGRVGVVCTANADVPWTAGMTPLLVVDLWEHAYYLDYQNRRAGYVEAVVENLLDWRFALHNAVRGR